MSSEKLTKFPRTPHIESSRMQDGDEDLDFVPFDKIRGRHLVIEEKADGAQAGISFPDLSLHLQSRGHYLTGGPREKQFEILKQWANMHSQWLLDLLEDRYIMYGEWMFLKHTVYYDMLPHYFMEFDILDTQEGTYLDGEGKEHQGSWLSTKRRRKMIDIFPICQVQVLFEGELDSLDQLTAMVNRSNFKSLGWRMSLIEECATRSLDANQVLAQTDQSDLMEGLYIKVEEDGVVKERYKWVRGDFLQAIKEADSHHLDRPIVANRLAPGTDIYSMGNILDGEES
jgi:hypothetical protein